MKANFNNIKLFKKEFLYVIEYSIKIKVDALKELIEDDEKSIRKIEQDLEQYKTSFTLLGQEEQYKTLLEEKLIDKEQIIQQIIIQKRFSTCLLIYSIFESALMEICHEIQRKVPSKAKMLAREKEEDLLKFKNYLTKDVGIDFRAIEPSFTKIKQQKVIRNSIAHRNGNLRKSDKTHRIDGLKIEKNKIVLEQSYFDSLIIFMETFFENLLIEIDKKLILDGI